MPIVRYDPPKKRRNPLTTFRQFFTAPLETVLSLATRREPDDAAIYISRPVEVDTDTGEVTVEKIERKGGRDARLTRMVNLRADAAKVVLAEAFASGKVPTQYPPGYRQVAEHVAGLRKQFDTPVSPDETPDSYRQPSDPFNMAIIPPGGYAGFSQMTPASRLALTRGARGRAAPRRRKAKRKKAKKPAKRRTKRAGKRKLVKGSAAARRFMANLRKKRRK